MHDLLMYVRCVLTCGADQEKREVPNLESFLSVGELGLAPASLSFPTRFLEGDSETEKQRNTHTIIGNATHIIYIWAHLLLSSPMS